MIITNVLSAYDFYCGILLAPGPQNFLHMPNTLFAGEPPRDFFPAAFPTKVRKLRVGDFEVVRGQASLTAEARRTRVFCSVSLNFSIFRLLAPSHHSLLFPSTTHSSVRPSVCSPVPSSSPVRLAADSGGVRWYYLSCEYQTRAGAALYYNLLTDVIITILYK